MADTYLTRSTTLQRHLYSASISSEKFDLAGEKAKDEKQPLLEGIKGFTTSDIDRLCYKTKARIKDHCVSMTVIHYRLWVFE